MRSFILSSRYGVEKICVFNLGWLALLAEKDDAKVVSYEGLHAQPHQVIKDLIAFLNPDLLNTVDIQSLVQRTSLEEMRKAEKIGNPVLGVFSADLNDPESYKVRRGEVGGYHKYLSEETIQAARDILRRYRYDEFITTANRSANALNGFFQTPRINQGNLSKRNLVVNSDPPKRRLS